MFKFDSLFQELFLQNVFTLIVKRVTRKCPKDKVCVPHELYNFELDLVVII